MYVVATDNFHGQRATWTWAADDLYAVRPLVFGGLFFYVLRQWTTSVLLGHWPMQFALSIIDQSVCENTDNDRKVPVRFDSCQFRTF